MRAVLIFNLPRLNHWPASAGRLYVHILGNCCAVRLGCGLCRDLLLVSALSVAGGLSYVRLDCFRLNSFGAWAYWLIVRELK